MVRALMGVETEYAISCKASNGEPVPRSEGLGRLMESALTHLASLPGRGSSGVFLGNGGRFYIDCSHPEYATAECSDPWLATRHIRAGEHLLLQLADYAALSMGDGAEGVEVSLFRFQVNYDRTETTWGCHESYLHGSPPDRVCQNLIPHLVSRVIYTGAGGLNPLSEGIEFTLSPRSWLLQHPHSHDSTANRGIIHTKDESLAEGAWKRLHLLCGESLGSDTASVLKLGTTALIMCALDAGRSPGTGVVPVLPVKALRSFVSDPTLRARARLSTGPEVTALEIQRHYLEAIERYRAEDVLPDWAGELCVLWRRVLDQLEDDPGSLALTLDWRIKQALYEPWLDERLREEGLDRAWLTAWSEILDRLRDEVTESYPSNMSLERALFGSADLPRLALQRARRRARARGLSWSTLPFFFRLKSELCEMDVHFGKLGDGIFDQLDAAGHLEHRLVSEEDVARATEHPPDVGRARLRGTWVRTLSARPGRPGRCEWTRVEDREKGRMLRLTDPWQEVPVWEPLEGTRPRIRRPPQLRFPDMDLAESDLFGFGPPGSEGTTPPSGTPGS